MRTDRLLLFPIFCLASCSTTSIRVPVMVPAPVNLVQYDLVAVDRFEGEGCEPFSDQLAAALGTALNPMTGQPGFEVLHRKDIDQALDQIRDRRGADWDDRTMAVLDRWRQAQIVLKGFVEQHGVQDQITEERSRDRQGNEYVRRRLTRTARVQVHLEATDVEGNRSFDGVTLSGSAGAHRYLDDQRPVEIDPQPLLAAARQQVVQQYLNRVLPHQQWVAVQLYDDGDFPDLRIGNGYAETGNWEAAAQAYQRALDTMTGEFAEQRYMGLFNLGVAHEFSDRFQEARKALEEAYAIGQDQRILDELRRNAAREDEVRRLREQSAAKPQR